MASYSRFNDERYKNWLKTTMSLQLLRSRLGRFLENETETFHNSLKNKLKETTCKNNCIIKGNQKIKVPQVCPDCEAWREEILQNHNNKKGDIYWNNSKPCLWSSNKWEVAKVYMPRGNKDHHAVDQFDISAVLNLMNNCSHFKKFVKEQILKEVTNVRNQMMHSADMKVAKEDMKKYLLKILDFVKRLRDQVPELKELEDEISQLEEAELNIMVEGQDTTGNDAAMNLLKQKMLDLEQQVMKEKIDTLAFRLEEGKELNNEEFLRMKEFLDRNKDLLEQLGPHMEKFNAIQVKVEQHDQQLTILTETVDQLVKKTEEPVFSADTVKYKNHLLEEAKKNKWPDPVFSEVRKPQGYIGQVMVNGQTFTGCCVHPKVKAAHQEVSMIALDQLNMQSMEEGADQSTSTSTGNRLFFAAVKVPVKTEFEGPEAGSSEAAILEAYKSLEQALNLRDTGAGISSDGARQRVQDFFSLAGCGLPEERSYTTDGKFRSKLCIDGVLTFQNPVGKSKKQLAEQAAAKEALFRLAPVLDWDLAGINENYKGRLQELLVKQGQELPSYQPVYEPFHTEPSQRGEESEKAIASVPVLHAAVTVTNIEHQAKQVSVDTNLCPPQIQKPKTETPAPVMPTVQPSESNLTQSTETDVPLVHNNTVAGQAIIPAMPINTNESSASSAKGSFFAAVKVPVETEFEGPEAGSSEAAVLEAYKSLEQALNLRDTGTGISSDGAKQRVQDFFSRAGCGLPEECSYTTDGKFRSKLRINGNLTFQNPGLEGKSKKQLAEQAAAKEALFRLAVVLDWDLAGINENYKGRLQELLVKQGQEPPFYQPVYEPFHTEPSQRGEESEKGLASAPIPQAAVSGTPIEQQAIASVDSNLCPPQIQKPKTENPAPVMPTVQPSESNLTLSTETDVPLGHNNTVAGQAIMPAMPIHTNESPVSSAKGPFFAAVKVPVKTEFEGPEAGTSEAAGLEAYKSLEQALTLRDTGAGISSDGARERVHDFFSRAGCGLPEECSGTTDGKFRSTLRIDGYLIFQNPVGKSKKQLAEQAAAEEALFRLAPVLDWDLAGINENYKGRLQELLVKQGQELPSYQPVYEPFHTEPSHRGEESEKGLAIGPIPQAEVSVTNIQQQAIASVDSNLCPPQIQKPKTETPAAVTPTTQSSESNLSQSSDTDVPLVHHETAAVQAIVPAIPILTKESYVSSAKGKFFAAVKVPVKIEFEGPEAGSSEAAVLEAYKSLEQALNLRDTGTGISSDGARERVQDFFSRAGCELTEECISTTDGKFRSKLRINGTLTFQNPEGKSKKQLAEHAAAKEALFRLAAVLGWDLGGLNENYKGRLQELLVKQGQGPPSYQPVLEPFYTELSHGGAESLTSGPDISTTQPISTDNTQRKSLVDHTELLPDRKKSWKEYPDFRRMLKMFGLEPTSVIFENHNVKQNFQLTLEINLVDFTYTNQQGYSSKKDAIRKTYLMFGQAIGICEPSTEEIQASKVVKQHFSQSSFRLPTEEVEEKEPKKFYCSLKVASIRLSYAGQGKSEETARAEASKQALSQLGPLLGYKSLCSSVEAEDRLTLLLEDAGQGLPVVQKTDSQYKASVQINFNEFTVESKGQNTKKSAQSQLCSQILILLGQEETETSKGVSERNRVDDWFRQNQFAQPVFEDTKESAPDKRVVFGMKATFSGHITCSHPDWKKSEKEAVTDLTEELKRRFQAC